MAQLGTFIFIEHWNSLYGLTVDHFPRRFAPPEFEHTGGVKVERYRRVRCDTIIMYVSSLFRAR